jgi:hypothetical protein
MIILVLIQSQLGLPRAETTGGACLMLHNRITHFTERPAVESDVPAIPPGFAYCPNPNPNGRSAQQPLSLASSMYQSAYQQAVQEARDRAWRAFLDRALFSTWN